MTEQEIIDAVTRKLVDPSFYYVVATSVYRRWDNAYVLTCETSVEAHKVCDRWNLHVWKRAEAERNEA